MYASIASVIVSVPLVATSSVILAALPMEGIGLHALLGAVAACWLLGLCKAGELLGNQENCSAMPPERRLPNDSDGMLAVALLLLGAVIGLAVSMTLIFIGRPVSNYWPVTLTLAVLVGIFVPWPMNRKIAADYLKRAKQNINKGNYKHAVEDAAEVERLSEVYKREAILIKELAIERRNRQIDNIAPVVEESTLPIDVYSVAEVHAD